MRGLHLATPTSVAAAVVAAAAAVVAAAGAVVAVSTACRTDWRPYCRGSL